MGRNRYLVWWGAERMWPPLLAAAIVVAADLALTGMLHFDGLIDSADGLREASERRVATPHKPLLHRPDTAGDSSSGGHALIRTPPRNRGMPRPYRD